MSQLTELLTNAMHEIRQLRRENEVLHAKCDVMEFFAQVLNTTPAMRSPAAAPDVAWALEKRIAELASDDVAKAA